MLKPFWIEKEYKRELLKDALNLFPKRKSLSFFKDWCTNRINAGSHMLKYETIWELFYNKQISNILDIGAYDGTDSIILSRIFNKAKIYSFEADSNNYSKLVTNIKYRRNIIPINAAVSNNSGEIEFYASENVDERLSNMDASGSILFPTEENEKVWPNMKFKKPIKVKCISIKDWAEQQKGINIDFIWMDVQGAELLVLEGAEKHLLNVKGIIAEVWDDSIFYKDSVDFSQLNKYLTSKGFRLSHLWKPGGSGDALFLNNTFF